MSNICLLPWIHLEARPSGEASPCCMYKGTIGSFANQSLDEVWHSPEMNQLRNEFLKGNKPKRCSNCWSTEASGNRSKRQVDNEKFSHHIQKISQPVEPPVYLDLKLGTICNIKCRTCSTFSSFKWADDEIKIYGETCNKNLQSFWINDTSPFWNDLEKILPYIEYFDFTGGEPLLIKRHIDLLEKCVELGYAKDISIHYNTNGTILPTERMVKVWKEFKWVEVMFSIDGTKEKFDYIRHPAKWDEVEYNFNIVKSHDFLHVSICHTVSVLNVLYLPDFLEWFKSTGLEENQLYLNLLHSPNYYCVKNLAPKQKQVITNVLKDNPACKQIIDFMNIEDVDYSKKFLEMTQKVDAIRNESFSKIFPELSNIL